MTNEALKPTARKTMSHWKSVPEMSIKAKPKFYNSNKSVTIVPGTPKPLLRHSRSKLKEGTSVADRFKSQPISFPAPEVSPSEPPIEQAFSSLAQSKSTANVLDRDEDGKFPI